MERRVHTSTSQRPQPRRVSARRRKRWSIQQQGNGKAFVTRACKNEYGEGGDTRWRVGKRERTQPLLVLPK